MEILPKMLRRMLFMIKFHFRKKRRTVSRIDVIIATPPCQGMSVANHKKSETEIVRNPLVIEYIKVIKQINPRFFIFDNVPTFMKTVCTDIDGEHKSIAAAIEKNIGQAYSYTSRVINFKNYGACSSRQCTVIIGVRNLPNLLSILITHKNDVSGAWAGQGKLETRINKNQLPSGLKRSFDLSGNNRLSITDYVENLVYNHAF